MVASLGCRRRLEEVLHREAEAGLRGAVRAALLSRRSVVSDEVDTMEASYNLAILSLDACVSTSWSHTRKPDFGVECYIAAI